MIDSKEIIKADKEKRVVYGAKKTLEALKSGELENIFVTSSCPDDIRAQIKELAELAKIKVNLLEETSEEFSALCKKPFNIAVAGVLKGKEK